MIDNNDVDKKALSIEAANTTSDVILVVADSLAEGGAMHIKSDSSSTATRSLVKIHNDHTSATGTTPLEIDNDADTSSGSNVFQASMGSNGSTVGLKVKEGTISSINSAGAKTIAGFLPANSVPVAIAIRVTIEVNGGFVQSGGITGDTDCFFSGLSDGTLSDAGDTATFGVSSMDPTRTISQAARELSIGVGGTPSAGEIRIALYYYDITPPTS